MIKSFAKAVGVDKAIAFTIIGRVVQAGGSLFSVIFIAKFLTNDEQGYFYTFSSILAIQIFFELGLNTIITQYVAHEKAHLVWSDDNTLIGESVHKSRLGSLIQFCTKWFFATSSVLFFVLIIAGYIFFSNYNSNLKGIIWEGPWIILCFATVGLLMTSPLMAFLEGLGKVKEVAQIRLGQQCANVVLLVGFLSLRYKLYSTALASLISFLILAVILFISSRKMLIYIWKLKSVHLIDYKNEIFPYQWRLALSWISGYFIFQLFNPVLFATEGASVAGQMGMTLAALNGISALAMSWVNTKVPLFSNLISQRDFVKLDTIFKKTIFQSVAVCGCLMLIFIATIFFLRYRGYLIANRFLGFLPLTLLCMSVLSNLVTYALATYLRCHKKEPLLIQSIVMGLLCCLSTVILGQFYGVLGITTGYFFLTVFIGMVWVILIYKIKKQLWQTSK